MPDSITAVDTGEYLDKRIKDQIDWYNAKSAHNQTWYKRLQVFQVAGAAAIPFLVGLLPTEGLWDKAIVGGLGALLAIATGVSNLYKFQEHWIEYRTTCEALTKERFVYLTRTEPYDDKDESKRFSLLVRRVEALVSKENANWAQCIMNPGEGQQTAPKSEPSSASA